MMTEVEYWKKLAGLYQDQIGCLMAGNHVRFAVLGRQIEGFSTGEKNFRPCEAPAVEKLQRLKDALASITQAVNNIL